MLHDDGYELSDKSQLVGNSSKLVERAYTLMRRHDFCGVPTRKLRAAHTKDLGVTTTGGHKRSTVTVRKRIGKASQRARRVGAHARELRSNCKLFNAGAYRQATYGITAVGASPPLMNALRKAAANSTGILNAGRDTSTLIGLTLGRDADPYTKLRLDQFRSWARILRLNPDLHERITRCWHVKYRRLRARQERKWDIVKGPIAATLATFIDIGFSLPHVASWTTRDNVPVQFDPHNPHEWGDMLSAIRTACEISKWEQDQVPPPDLFAVKAMLDGKLKKGERADHTICLRASVGVLPTEQVLFDKDIITSHCCRRCGAPNATLEHHLYMCPKTLADTDDAIVKTRRLVRAWRSDKYQPSRRSLFIKGLPPLRVPAFPGCIYDLSLIHI